MAALTLSKSAWLTGCPFITRLQWCGSGWLTDRLGRGRGINSHSKRTCAERGPWWPGGTGWAGLGWRGCRSGSAALARAGHLAPGVILGSCWCDQHGHQSKAFVPEAKAASLAMLTDMDIRVVGSDSSQLVVAAGALTEWNGSHPSCHSAFKNNPHLFQVATPPSVWKCSPLAVAVRGRAWAWRCVCVFWGGWRWHLGALLVIGI